MRRRRTGFTLVEIILVLAVIALLILGAVLWMRVDKINTWAVEEQAWSDSVYTWIKSSSFQQGPLSGGADPDGIKPPPPPRGL